jgi:predicted DNA-binding transcriptional regulator AlpA
MITKVTDAPEKLAVSISSAAQMSGISRSFFYQLLRQGEGPPVFHLGARTLVLLSDLRAWLAARRGRVA